MNIDELAKDLVIPDRLKTLYQKRKLIQEAMERELSLIEEEISDFQDDIKNKLTMVPDLANATLRGESFELRWRQGGTRRSINASTDNIISTVLSVADEFLRGSNTYKICRADFEKALELSLIKEKITNPVLGFYNISPSKLSKHLDKPETEFKFRSQATASE